MSGLGGNQPEEFWILVDRWRFHGQWRRYISYWLIFDRQAISIRWGQRIGRLRWGWQFGLRVCDWAVQAAYSASFRNQFWQRRRYVPPRTSLWPPGQDWACRPG